MELFESRGSTWRMIYDPTFTASKRRGNTGVLDELEKVETDVPNETENEMTDEEEEIPCDLRNRDIMDAMLS